MTENRKHQYDDLLLRFESLEERRLLAADTTTVDLSDLNLSSTSFASDFLAWQQTLAPSTSEFTSSSFAGASHANLQLPAGLPESFSVEVEYAGEVFTLELSKNSIFGENTKFLVDDGTGELVRVNHGEDRSYLGTVTEDPRLVVSAWLGEAGLHATIIRPNQPSIIVEPLSGENRTVGQHRVFVEAEAPASNNNHDHNGDGIPDHAPGDHNNETDGGHPPGCSCLGCCGMASDTEVSALTPSAASGEDGPFSEADPNISATTLPPSRTIEIREFEVGVEIGSAALLNNYSGSTTQQKVDSAMSVAQGIPGNLDARFLRAAGIKHRLGTVIIRTGSDPFNVANGNDSAGLSAFRNYWNSNPQEVGNTHDLAVYHVRANPSGLAYVNSVGTSSRYALSASNGPTSWANGTLAHEFGHSWSLGHVPSGTTSSASFYESKPRSNGNAAGGDDVYISIMHGSGNRNIGRLSTGEANQVLGVKQSKLQFGDTVANEPEVAPFGWADGVTVGSSDPIIIDVVANDHDANNDVLDAQLRDTVSFLGGTISLSLDTGPGGRNELLYTPPANSSGTDFFHYTVVDSTGRTDWGAVYVTLTEVTVDLSQTFFSYDLGTPTSPVFSSQTVQAVRVSHETTGDITWSSGVLSEDRANSGENAYNRDFVRGFQDTTWSHKLASGIWRVTLNMSDPEFSFDNMFVDAEGERKVSDIDRPQGVNTTFNFEVTVNDGFLDLTFGDDDTVDPRWAVNRINLERIGDADYVVDLNADGYTYDFGPLGSPVFIGATPPAQRITPETFGDINWSETVFAEDREVGNDFNRDLVWGTGDTTWSHEIREGVWRVTLNMSDAQRNLDNMFVTAEGTYGISDIDHPIGTNNTLEFDVPVTDGTLNLVFGDADTSNPLWAVNRVVLTRLGDVPTSIGPGDFDENGQIDGEDLSQWEGDYGINGDSDANSDGQSNGFDFLMWQRNFGAGISTSATILDASTGNGSFENQTGAVGLLVDPANRRVYTNNTSPASIPGWTAILESGVGGWDGALTHVASEGDAYALANDGAVVTLSSDVFGYSVLEGDTLTISVDVGSSNGVAHDFTAELILGGNTYDLGTISDGSPVSGGVGEVLNTRTFSYTTSANDVGTNPQVVLTIANQGGSSQAYLDNVRLVASGQPAPINDPGTAIAALEAPPLEQPYIEGYLYVPEPAAIEGSFYALAQAASVAPEGQEESEVTAPSATEVITISSPSPAEVAADVMALDDALTEIGEENQDKALTDESENFSEALDLAFQSL